jgi:hypothetical protein
MIIDAIERDDCSSGSLPPRLTQDVLYGPDPLVMSRANGALS